MPYLLCYDSLSQGHSRNTVPPTWRARRGRACSCSIRKPPGLGAPWKAELGGSHPQAPNGFGTVITEAVWFKDFHGQLCAADSPQSSLHACYQSCILLIKLIKVVLDQMWLLSRDSPRPCQTSLGLIYVVQVSVIYWANEICMSGKDHH